MLSPSLSQQEHFHHIPSGTIQPQTPILVKKLSFLGLLRLLLLPFLCYQRTMYPSDGEVVIPLQLTQRSVESLLRLIIFLI